MMTEAEKKEILTKAEIKMFGTTEDNIREHYMNCLTAKLSGHEMVVAGILSDCQEMIYGGDELTYDDANLERVRQSLNIAKFILFEMMKTNREEF